MKKAIVAFLHALLYPALYLGSQALVSMYAAVVYMVGIGIGSGVAGLIDPSTTDGLTSFLSGQSIQLITIFSCLVTCIVVVIVLLVRRSGGRETLVIKPIPVAEVALLIVLGISMNLATVYIMSVVPIPESVLAEYEELVGNVIIGQNFWLTFLSTAVLVPITEELIFRGMSFNVMRRRMHITVAFILQTLLFAGVHLIPLQILYVLPASAVLGLVYIWSGNFVAPVILHMTYNGLSVALNYLVPSTDEVVAVSPAQYIPFIVGSVAIMVLCLVALYKRREQKEIPGSVIGV